MLEIYAVHLHMIGNFPAGWSNIAISVDRICFSENYWTVGTVNFDILIQNVVYLMEVKYAEINHSL